MSSTIVDPQFRARLIAMFQVEARQHMQVLVDFASQPPSPQAGDTKITLDMAFRAAHSLKGAARAVDEPEIERQCMIIDTFLRQTKATGQGWTAATHTALCSHIRQLSQACRDVLPDEGRADA
jgi:two-component system chemotaxis sensor kinase CheA